MTARYDVIVAGVGGMGSAAVHHLARRGRRVLGLERFDIPNDMGSSHGVTRIIRYAYYEDRSYVPLLTRAYELWEGLEDETAERLLHITGSLDVSVTGDRLFEGSRDSCVEHGLPHEALTGTEVNRRFPGYRMPAEARALLQPRGGFLLPERCIAAHVARAVALGAEVRAREQVLGWEAAGTGVRVTTARGVYEADRLIVTAGAWAGRLVNGLRGLAVPERQVLAWLQPRRPELFGPDRFPVFNLECEEGRYYGFPVFGIPGFKLGRYHHRGEVTDPDLVDRECHPEDEAVLVPFASRYFPDGAGPTLSLMACMFTNSPDEHFIVDVHPGLPQVSVAAGFSGHGFKFCSVVGEIMADLAEEGRTEHDIGLFRLARFL
jgi:sarcosine oxidase